MIYQSGGTFYVDTVNGSDANDGSNAHPWKTIGHALAVMASCYAFCGTAPIIRVVAGSTLTEQIGIPQLTGCSGVYITGTLDMNALTPWNLSAGACAIEARDNVTCIAKGFKTSGGNIHLKAAQGGILDYDFWEFGPAGGVHVAISNAGQVNAGGNYAITGGAQHHVESVGAGCNHSLNGATVYMPQNLAFPGAFIKGSGPGAVNWTGNVFTDHIGYARIIAPAVTNFVPPFDGNTSSSVLPIL